MWFLPGLPGGRVGLFMRLHHAIADGAAGVALLGALLDADPDAPPPRRSWVPAPMPSGRELLVDNVRRRVKALDRATSRLARPIDTVRKVRAVWPALREVTDQHAPRTSLNRPIGPDRRLAVLRSPMDPVRRVAHSQGATVNDVLLAAISGGLRDLLSGRGDEVDDVVLRAMVPVSLHRGQPGPARGNRDGAMVVPLPIGVADPARRLRLIAAATAERKRRARPAGGTMFPSPLLQRAFLHVATRQRIFNVYVANVPGPPVPLRFAGAPVLEIFPVVPIMANVTLGVGALSYEGQLTVTAVADRDTCPDVDVFTEGVRRSLRTLTRAR